MLLKCSASKNILIVFHNEYNIYYTQKNIKKSYKNNTWNDKFEFPKGSYSVSDIQANFECIEKQLGERKDNPSISIYVIKVWNSITFKFETVYYLELLTPEAINLLGSTKSKITNWWKWA